VLVVPDFAVFLVSLHEQQAFAALAFACAIGLLGNKTVAWWIALVGDADAPVRLFEVFLQMPFVTPCGP